MQHSYRQLSSAAVFLYEGRLLLHSVNAHLLNHTGQSFSMLTPDLRRCWQ